ncbi:TM2 domain-containing protein almondex [Phymastichus coffea]|uniref:TM2 domain-containing protein almondex n=1 Tax=Phymastichus coffea TaxID=108790 RepID=UPI00273C7181|nr:TM2 domain-containing protein almondex [Phymastichus coffea]
MNVVRINTKNVVYLIIAILSTSVREAHMDYGDTISNYASNNNSTPAYTTKKEDLSNICPAGNFCSKLSAECLLCTLNHKCNYGVTYQANCTVLKQIDCVGDTNFAKPYICRYCYQTDHWEHDCLQKNSCSSVASPQQYYRTNCTVKSDILCLGKRRFLKNLRCNWTGGYRWSTALILSITLGGFGADRFYLGHWQEGIGKLFSFGGLGVWTLIDVMLISMRYLGPADGSLYV